MGIPEHVVRALQAFMDDLLRSLMKHCGNSRERFQENIDQLNSFSVDVLQKHLRKLKRTYHLDVDEVFVGNAERFMADFFRHAHNTSAIRSGYYVVQPNDTNNAQTIRNIIHRTQVVCAATTRTSSARNTTSKVERYTEVGARARSNRSADTRRANFRQTALSRSNNHNRTRVAEETEEEEPHDQTVRARSVKAGTINVADRRSIHPSQSVSVCEEFVRPSVQDSGSTSQSQNSQNQNGSWMRHAVEIPPEWIVARGPDLDRFGDNDRVSVRTSELMGSMMDVPLNRASRLSHEKMSTYIEEPEQVDEVSDNDDESTEEKEETELQSVQSIAGRFPQPQNQSKHNIATSLASLHAENLVGTNNDRPAKKHMVQSFSRSSVLIDDESENENDSDNAEIDD